MVFMFRPDSQRQPTSVVVWPAWREMQEPNLKYIGQYVVAACALLTIFFRMIGKRYFCFEPSQSVSGALLVPRKISQAVESFIDHQVPLG